MLTYHNISYTFVHLRKTPNEYTIVIDNCYYYIYIYLHIAIVIITTKCIFWMKNSLYIIDWTVIQYQQVMWIINSLYFNTNIDFSFYYLICLFVVGRTKNIQVTLQWTFSRSLKVCFVWIEWLWQHVLIIIIYANHCCYNNYSEKLNKPI